MRTTRAAERSRWRLNIMSSLRVIIVRPGCKPPRELFERRRSRRRSTVGRGGADYIWEHNDPLLELALQAVTPRASRYNVAFAERWRPPHPSYPHHAMPVHPICPDHEQPHGLGGPGHRADARRRRPEDV